MCQYNSISSTQCRQRSSYCALFHRGQCLARGSSSADLADIAEEHHVTIHSFADDTQLYLHCRRNDVKLEHCIRDINQWMAGNRLKLNMDKGAFTLVRVRVTVYVLQ